MGTKTNGKKKILTCPFNEQLKKWESVQTFRSALSKFQRILSKKRALGNNGLTAFNPNFIFALTGMDDYI